MTNIGLVFEVNSFNAFNEALKTFNTLSKNVDDNLKKMSSAVNSFDSKNLKDTGTHLTKLAKGLDDISKIGNLNTTSTSIKNLFDVFSNVKLSGNGDLTKISKAISDTTSALKIIKSSFKEINQISSGSLDIEGVSSDIDSISDIINILRRFNDADIGTINKNLKSVSISFSSTVSSIKNIINNAEDISKLVNGANLSAVEKDFDDIGNVIAILRRFRKSGANLEDSDTGNLGKLARSFSETTSAILLIIKNAKEISDLNLSTFEKIKAGFGRAEDSIKDVVDILKRFGDLGAEAARNLDNSNLGLLTSAFSRTASAISIIIKESEEIFRIAVGRSGSQNNLDPILDTVKILADFSQQSQKIANRVNASDIAKLGTAIEAVSRAFKNLDDIDLSISNKAVRFAQFLLSGNKIVATLDSFYRGLSKLSAFNPDDARKLGQAVESISIALRNVSDLPSQDRFTSFINFLTDGDAIVQGIASFAKGLDRLNDFNASDSQKLGEAIDGIATALLKISQIRIPNRLERFKSFLGTGNPLIVLIGSMVKAIKRVENFDGASLANIGRGIEAIAKVALDINRIKIPNRLQRIKSFLGTGNPLVNSINSMVKALKLLEPLDGGELRKLGLGINNIINAIKTIGTLDFGEATGIRRIFSRTSELEKDVKRLEPVFKALTKSLSSISDINTNRIKDFGAGLKTIFQSLEILNGFQVQTTGFIFKRRELTKLKEAAEGLAPVLKQLVKSFSIRLNFRKSSVTEIQDIFELFSKLSNQDFTVSDKLERNIKEVRSIAPELNRVAKSLSGFRSSNIDSMAIKNIAEAIESLARTFRQMGNAEFPPNLRSKITQIREVLPEIRSMQDELSKFRSQGAIPDITLPSIRGEDSLDGGRDFESRLDRMFPSLGTYRDIARTIARGGKIVLSALKDFGGNLNQGFRDVGESLREGGETLREGAERLAIAGAVFGAISGGVIGTSIISAVDFESQLTDVFKTLDLSDLGSEQAQQFKEGFELTLRDLAINPDSLLSGLENAQESVTRIAAGAGQLGIARESIVPFVETIGQLTLATDLAEEQAAFFIARFTNITGTDNFEQIGSSIVNLGNNFAATEAEIAGFAERLVGSGSLIGFTEDQILALSAASAASGLNAEAAGTSFTNFANKIVSAVAEGGAELDVFAQVSGETADEFVRQFNEAPDEAFTGFLQGLDKLDATARNSLFATLGITGVREKEFLNLLSANVEGLEDAFTIAEEGFKAAGDSIEDYNALQQEAATRAATTRSQIERFKNTVRDLSIAVGQALLPDFQRLLELVTNVVLRFRNWAEANPELVAQLGRVLGVVTALVVAFATIGSTILFVTGVVATLVGGALSGLSLVISGIAAAIFNPAGLLAALIGLSGVVAGVVAVFGALGIIFVDIALNGKQIADSILRLGESFAGLFSAIFALGNEVVRFFTLFTDAGDDAAQSFSPLATIFNFIADAIDSATMKLETFFSSLKRINDIREAITFDNFTESDTASGAASEIQSLERQRSEILNRTDQTAGGNAILTQKDRQDLKEIETRIAAINKETAKTKTSALSGVLGSFVGGTGTALDAQSQDELNKLLIERNQLEEEYNLALENTDGTLGGVVEKQVESGDTIEQLLRDQGFSIADIYAPGGALEEFRELNDMQTDFILAGESYKVPSLIAEGDSSEAERLARKLGFIDEQIKSVEASAIKFKTGSDFAAAFNSFDEAVVTTQLLLIETGLENAGVAANNFFDGLTQIISGDFATGFDTVRTSITDLKDSLNDVFRGTFEGDDIAAEMAMFDETGFLPEDEGLIPNDFNPLQGVIDFISDPSEEVMAALELAATTFAGVVSTIVQSAFTPGFVLAPVGIFKLITKLLDTTDADETFLATELGTQIETFAQDILSLVETTFNSVFGDDALGNLLGSLVDIDTAFDTLFEDLIAAFTGLGDEGNGLNNISFFEDAGIDVGSESLLTSVITAFTTFFESIRDSLSTVIDTVFTGGINVFDTLVSALFGDDIATHLTTALIGVKDIIVGVIAGELDPVVLIEEAFADTDSSGSNAFTEAIKGLFKFEPEDLAVGDGLNNLSFFDDAGIDVGAGGGDPFGISSQVTPLVEQALITLQDTIAPSIANVAGFLIGELLLAIGEALLTFPADFITELSGVDFDGEEIPEGTFSFGSLVANIATAFVDGLLESVEDEILAPARAGDIGESVKGLFTLALGGIFTVGFFSALLTGSGFIAAFIGGFSAILIPLKGLLAVAFADVISGALIVGGKLASGASVIAGIAKSIITGIATAIGAVGAAVLGGIALGALISFTLGDEPVFLDASGNPVSLNQGIRDFFDPVLTAIGDALSFEGGEDFEFHLANLFVNAETVIGSAIASITNNLALFVNDLQITLATVEREFQRVRGFDTSEIDSFIEGLELEGQQLELQKIEDQLKEQFIRGLDIDSVELSELIITAAEIGFEVDDGIIDVAINQILSDGAITTDEILTIEAAGLELADLSTEQLEAFKNIDFSEVDDETFTLIIDAFNIDITEFNSLDDAIAAIIAQQEGLSVEIPVTAEIALIQEIQQQQDDNAFDPSTLSSGFDPNSDLGFSSELLTVGQDVMQGLADGIEDNAHLPLDAGTLAIQDFVDGVSEQLGVESPSTVFITIGEEIMNGLSQGMTEGIPVFRELLLILQQELIILMEFIAGEFIETIMEAWTQMINHIEEEIDRYISALKRMEDATRKTVILIRALVNLIAPTFAAMSSQVNSSLTIVIAKVKELGDIARSATNDVLLLASALGATPNNLGGVGNNPTDTGGGADDPENRQFGGSVTAGRVYEILENNLPFELFRQSNGQTFFLPSQDGEIISPFNNQRALQGIGGDTSQFAGVNMQTAPSSNISTFNDMSTSTISVPVEISGTVNGDIDVNGLADEISTQVQNRLQAANQQSTFSDRKRLRGI